MICRDDALQETVLQEILAQGAEAEDTAAADSEENADLTGDDD